MAQPLRRSIILFGSKSLKSDRTVLWLYRAEWHSIAPPPSVASHQLNLFLGDKNLKYGHLEICWAVNTDTNAVETTVAPPTYNELQIYILYYVIVLILCKQQNCNTRVFFTLLSYRPMPKSNMCKSRKQSKCLAKYYTDWSWSSVLRETGQKKALSLPYAHMCTWRQSILSVHPAAAVNSVTNHQNRIKHNSNA